MLPEGVAYFAAENVQDNWLCYPWDAAETGRTIAEHEALAHQCSGERTKVS
jgi:hypothetical protein